MVKHLQTLEPANVSVNANRPAEFTILETYSAGPWTAQSENPFVAAVSPASSTTGVFTARAISAGSTTIAVRDRLGNVSYESVTAK